MRRSQAGRAVALPPSAVGELKDSLSSGGDGLWPKTLLAAYRYSRLH